MSNKENLPATNQLTDSGYVVEMGTTVSEYSAEKYKVGASTKDLITVLTKNPIVTKTHFPEELGFRIHYLREAAERGCKTDVHYNFIIAVWNSDKQGKKIIDNEYKLYVLSIANKMYKRLSTKYDLNGDLSKLVMQVTCEEEKYQAMLFEVMGGVKPPYLQSKELAQEIKENYQQVKKDLPYIIAAPLSADDFLKKWNEAMGNDSASKQVQQTYENSQVSAKEIDNSIDVEFEDAEEVKDEPKQELSPAKEKEQPKQEKKAEPKQEVKQQPKQQETAASGEEDKSAEFFDEDKDFNFED